MNRFLRLASNSAFIAGQRLINGCLQFFFFLLLINLFSSYELGLFELGRACLEIGTGVVVSGLAMIVIRENSRHHEWWLLYGRTITHILQRVVILVTIVIFFSVTVDTFGKQKTVIIAIFCWAIYYHSTCNIYESLLISINQVQWSMTTNVVCNVLTVGLGTAAVLLLPYPLISATVAIFLRWLLNHFINIHRIKKYYSKVPSPNGSNAVGIWEIMHHFWPLTLGSIFFIIYARIDTIMLEWMGTEESIALYSGAYRFVGLISMIFLSVYQAVIPTISRRFKISHRKAFNLVSVTGVTLGLAGLVIAVLLQFLAPKIIAIYPDAYEQTAQGLKVLAWTLPIIFAGNAFGYFLVNEKKVGVFSYAVINCIGLITNVVGNFVLIPIYDFIGAAWMTVVTDAFTTLMMVMVSLYIAFWMKQESLESLDFDQTA